MTAKIKNGAKVKWKTKNRWGKGSKEGVVLAFIPRNQPAIKILGAKKAVSFRGTDKNTVNDRYAVQHKNGTITAPRAPTLERLKTS